MHLVVEQPLGQRDRHPGADSDDVQVVDRGEVLDEESELLQGERERVAPGDDDISDLGMITDVLDHPLVVA